MTLRDFSYAARTLRKSPVFTLTAVLTIALGVGAGTAVFSVANAVLLRPLPYKEADRLTVVLMDLDKRGVKNLPLPVEDFIDLRTGAKDVFQDMASVVTFTDVLDGEDGNREQVRVAAVTPNFFSLLGLKIALGRDFQESDGIDQQPPQRITTYAILSHDFWRRRYGGSSAILGQKLGAAGGNGPVVVGVLAPGAELLFPPHLNVERSPEFWTAARLRFDNRNRNNFSQRVIGRLQPGATLQQAQARTDAITAQLLNAFPMKATSGFRLRLEPMHAFLVADVRPAILALMGAGLFLLLIACANVANLLLVRAWTRERELAVRAALGGSQWRLATQIFAECLLLSAAGTIAGIAVARFGIDAFLALAPENLPRMESVDIDRTVLAFSALAGLFAAALFGLAPAFRAIRTELVGVLRSSGRTGSLASSGLLRNGVVIAEVALSFVLLIGSGLMFRSFLTLLAVHPGYDPNGLLTFQLFGPPRRTPEDRAAGMRAIVAALRAIPGVDAVAAADPFPLTGQFYPIRWGKEDALSDASKFQAVEPQVILPGYFAAMRTRLIAGRDFSDADNAPNRNVVIVDETLAAKAFPGESAPGKRILIRIRTPEPEWVEIIGVVEHQRTTSLAQAGREQIFFADGFLGHGAITRWALRTSSDPARLGESVRSAISTLGRGYLISEVRPMPRLMEQARANTRFSLLLLTCFASIAVLLAAIGLYGVLATVVRQRTAEIGLRMALGAWPRAIFQLIVGQGLRLSLAGILAGILAALALTRLMTSMLVGVQPFDLATYVATVVLFLIITVFASWLPARRAAILHPSVALREE